MASYTLVEKTLRRWLGEHNPRARPVKDGVPTGIERRAGLLRQNVEMRLAQEFQVRTDSRKRWLDILDAEKKSDALDGPRIRAALVDYYLAGTTPRIATIFRELIESAPLQGWPHPPADKVYSDPGGLAAVDYAINPSLDPSETRSVVQGVLVRLAALYAQQSAALPASRTSARDQRICAAFGKALEQLAGEKTLFDRHFSAWNEKIAKARVLLNDLLHLPPDRLPARIRMDGGAAVLAEMNMILNDDEPAVDFRELPTPPPFAR